MADNGANVGDETRLAGLTLAVLAGGRGTRMGTPKALLRAGDQPLLAWLLDRWHWPGPTMLVTAPGIEHPPGCERFTRECVDPVADEGPLRGALTALEHSTTDRIVVTTCDMPLVETSHFVELLAELDHCASHIGVMCTRTSEDRQMIEPFPMALRHEAVEFVRAVFEAGERSPSALSSRSREYFSGMGVSPMPLRSKTHGRDALATNEIENTPLATHPHPRPLPEGEGEGFFVVECNWENHVWTNLNRPADLEAFERYNARGGSS